jgi:phage baseplate assembly protein W
MSVLEAGLKFGAAEPALSGRAEVAYRVLTVLSTRPGSLPWRPDFGTRLSDLVGQPASPTLLNEAEWRVREALTRWLPDTPVVSCRAEAVPPAQSRDRRMLEQLGVSWGPERTLLSLGGEAELRVHLVVQTDAGPLSLQADLGL